MGTENNFDFLTEYLWKEKVKVDSNEFKFQLETHPDFPSLYALSDTLSFFKINNIAIRVDKANVEYLPERFIALLKFEKSKPFLSFLEERDDGYVYTGMGSKKFIHKDEFLSVWQEVVLIVEQTRDFVSPTSKKSKFLWFYFIAFCLIITLGIALHVDSFLIPSGILVLGCLSIFLTFEVIKQIFGINSSFASATCRVDSTQKYSCESVINSKRSKLNTILSLSDLSVLFFFGHLISFYIMSLAGYFQHFFDYSLIILTLAVPVVVYSLYYQWRIEKKWCTICLLIIGVLGLELFTFIMLGSFSTINLEIRTPLIFLSGFAISSMIWFLIKPMIKEYFELKLFKIKSIRFKRNYSQFKLALKDSKQLEYGSLHSEIYLGNPNAKLKLSLVTNPFCGHCAGMHKDLVEIVNRFGQDIRVNIRFNLQKRSSNDQSNLLHFKLANIYFQDGQNKFMEAMGAWFDNKNMEDWFGRYGNGLVTRDAEELFNLQYEQNAKNELLFTPALIIGEKLYPRAYDRSDLIYFISELMEDEDYSLEDSIKFSHAGF